ncbi:MAG: phosphatase PAP2 family protein [Chitinophagales bacterium]|nr:phosphatase PAP2 family protein [Chitinophagales bacterium]
MKEKLKNFLEAVTLKMLVVIAMFILSLFLFGLIAEEAVFENENGFDKRVFGLLSPFSNLSLIHLMQVTTFFGSRNFLLPAYLLLIAYLISKRKLRQAIDISVIALTSTALTFVMKEFFHRSRPDSHFVKGITTFSFPSGHAISSFVFSCVLIYLIVDGKMNIWPKWIISILLLLFSLLIGLSRIILHVHYPTDVIAGYCFGFAWIILSFWLLRKISLFNRFISSNEE